MQVKVKNGYRFYLQKYSARQISISWSRFCAFLSALHWLGAQPPPRWAPPGLSPGLCKCLPTQTFLRQTEATMRLFKANFQTSEVELRPEAKGWSRNWSSNGCGLFEQYLLIPSHFFAIATEAVPTVRPQMVLCFTADTTRKGRFEQKQNTQEWFPMSGCHLC